MNEAPTPPSSVEHPQLTKLVIRATTLTSPNFCISTPIPKVEVASLCDSAVWIGWESPRSHPTAKSSRGVGSAHSSSAAEQHTRKQQQRHHQQQEELLLLPETWPEGGYIFVKKENKRAQKPVVVHCSEDPLQTLHPTAAPEYKPTLSP